MCLLCACFWSVPSVVYRFSIRRCGMPAIDWSWCTVALFTLIILPLVIVDQGARAQHHRSMVLYIITMTNRCVSVNVDVGNDSCA